MFSHALDERVEGLFEAARRGTGLQDASRALAGFLDSEVLPHARAEEHTLYPAAARDPRMAPLAEAMIDEHRALLERAERLRAAGTGTPGPAAPAPAAHRDATRHHWGRARRARGPLIDRAGASPPACQYSQPAL